MTVIDLSSPPLHETPSLFGPIDQLLRQPHTILGRIEHDDNLGDVARAALVTILVSAAVFGGSIGAFRGGVQILFAAIKLPLVILFTAGLVAPAYSALRVVLQGETRVVRDFALVLASLARGSLLLAALTPLVLLAVSFSVSYHALILLVVVCCALAGLSGVVLFLRGTLQSGLGNLTISAVVALLVLLVGSQMTWTLRPYLVRPRTTSVPFVRAVEGSLFDAVAVSINSARGHYRSDYDFDSDGVW